MGQTAEASVLKPPVRHGDASRSVFRAQFVLKVRGRNRSRSALILRSETCNDDNTISSPWNAVTARRILKSCMHSFAPIKRRRNCHSKYKLCECWIHPHLPPSIAQCHRNASPAPQWVRDSCSCPTSWDSGLHHKRSGIFKKRGKMHISSSVFITNIVVM